MRNASLERRRRRRGALGVSVGGETMDSEKPGSRLFLGRKKWPYFYKPEHLGEPVPEDTMWVFGEQIFEDTVLLASLVIIEDESPGDAVMITEGLVITE